MTRDRGLQRVRLPSGLSLAYRSTGSSSGTPLLLLHAWGESSRAFGCLLPLLPPDVRVLALGLRGHGGSDDPHRHLGGDDGALQK